MSRSLRLFLLFVSLSASAAAQGTAASPDEAPNRAVVARIAAARGDAAAIAPLLDDHVMWTAPAERLVGRSAVAARLTALGLPGTLAADGPDRVVATGAAGQTVFQLLDGVVVSVVQTAPARPPRRS